MEKKITCKNCGKVYSIVEKGGNMDMRCSQCSGQIIQPSITLVRRCIVCGFTEEVKAGSIVFTGHCRNHIWTILSFGKEVHSDLNQKVAEVETKPFGKIVSKEDKKPSSKPTSRKRGSK